MTNKVFLFVKSYHDAEMTSHTCLEAKSNIEKPGTICTTRSNRSYSGDPQPQEIWGGY